MRQQIGNSQHDARQILNCKQCINVLQQICIHEHKSTATNDATACGKICNFENDAAVGRNNNKHAAKMYICKWSYADNENLQLSVRQKCKFTNDPAAKKCKFASDRVAKI